MALYAPVTNYKLVSEGLHPSRIPWVIDLGTVVSEFGAARKVLLGYELTDEDREYNGEVTRALIPQTLTLSFNPKATLRKVVEGVLGRAFASAEEAGAFDLGSLVGMACMVQVKHDTNGKGQTFANVGMVASVPRGTVVPPLEREPVFYEQPEKNKLPQPIPESLPDWLKNKIAAAPEHGASL